MADLPSPKLKLQAPPTHLQQLRIAYESSALRGMTSVERAKVLEQLSNLLVQAVGGEQRWSDHGDQ
jgi:hypothetical protein